MEAAKSILDRHTPVDIEERRKTYADAGWQRFDDTVPPLQTTPLQATPAVAPGDIAALDEQRGYAPPPRV